MVFGWLFGERKRQEGVAEPLGAVGLFAQAEEATNNRDVTRGEQLCRELVRIAPESPDAWNMLGVNLIRRGAADPATRTEAVIAWMRALALRPGDSRAADHLQTEIQFPEDLVAGLIGRLGEPAPVGDDAGAALAQIGPRARRALEEASSLDGAAGTRARAILAHLA